MVGFWEGLSPHGVSEETTQLTAKSRRQGILGNYESAWKKWSGWCDSWKVDPFRCPLKYDLEYLSYYSIMKSFYTEQLVYIDQPFLPVTFMLMTNQHPLVYSLLSGIFNLRPPQPKYLFVWDVQEVQHEGKQIDLEKKKLT